MKLTKIISVIAAAVLIFISGYFTGGIINREPSRIIMFGYQNSNEPNRIDYRSIIKDTENQAFIGNFAMIYLQKEKVTNVSVDEENPDVFVHVLSPKQYVGLIEAKLWFTDAGATIAERAGETWEDIQFYKIDDIDADYIKKTIDYNESIASTPLNK